MSEAKLIKQVLNKDGKVETHFDDGRIEFTVPTREELNQNLTPEEQIRNAGERMFKTVENYKGGGVKVPNDFGDVLNNKLNELDTLKEELEQMRKDKFALEYAESRTGGGKVSLNEPSKKFVYGGDDPYRTAINDLYDRFEKGDVQADILLNKMWSKIRPAIKELGRAGTIISGCPNPKCDAGLTQDTEVCPECGFDLIESGFKAYGDLWGVK